MSAIIHGFTQEDKTCCGLRFEVHRPLQAVYVNKRMTYDPKRMTYDPTTCDNCHRVRMSAESFRGYTIVPMPPAKINVSSVYGKFGNQYKGVTP